MPIRARTASRNRASAISDRRALNALLRLVDNRRVHANYVSVSHLRVDPTRVDALVKAFRARAHLVDAAPGFLGLEVWQSDKSPDEILMVSHWQTRSAFIAYMKSDAHRVSHDRIPADLHAAIKLERLDHQAGYDVVTK
jgi:heme-degrading monooxygenase HmoA